MNTSPFSIPYMYIFIYIYIHTHTHTHTYIYVSILFLNYKSVVKWTEAFVKTGTDL